MFHFNTYTVTSIQVQRSIWYFNNIIFSFVVIFTIPSYKNCRLHTSSVGASFLSNFGSQRICNCHYYLQYILRSMHFLTRPKPALQRPSSVCTTDIPHVSAFYVFGTLCVHFFACLLSFNTGLCALQVRDFMRSFVTCLQPSFAGLFVCLFYDNMSQPTALECTFKSPALP